MSFDLTKYHDRKVVLVDENDEDVGVAPLLEAHKEPGMLHRAFSLVIYRKNGKKIELLFQKRSDMKPIFPGYWSNTCCYNMAPGERYLDRVVTRAREEMGIDISNVKLQELYGFVYYAYDKDGWCERECDKVIVGEWDGEVSPNPEEASEYRWVEWNELIEDMASSPEENAPWTKMIAKDKRFAEWINRE